MVTALLTFALYTGASALVHWYLWRRLIHDFRMFARDALQQMDDVFWVVPCRRRDRNIDPALLVR